MKLLEWFARYWPYGWSQPAAFSRYIGEQQTGRDYAHAAAYEAFYVEEERES